MQRSSSSLDIDVEFPSFDGKVYVRVDGYFNFDSLKTKIPFEPSSDFYYYVENVENLSTLGEGEARSYYRQITRKPSDFFAILTSRNVVKKVRVKKKSV